MPKPFVAFGLDHLLALAVIALVAGGLIAVVRGWPVLAPVVRFVLAALTTALVAFELETAAREGWLGWTTVLPLELCDAAMVLAVLTLLRPRRWAAEVVYFWSCSGSVIALLTPDLRWDFPRWEFVVFFGLHGLVLASALLLVFGLGLHPRRGAPLRVLGITAAWTAFVGLVDLALGTNFMYLRHRPEVATPLDWMGPWPVYIAVSALLALGLFELLGLPFRREWSDAAC